MKRIEAIILIVLLAAVAGIAWLNDGPPSPTQGVTMPATTQTAAIALTSTAFGNGQPIPRKHTGEGEDVSPQLSWAAVPKGTRELALIVDDPDAPRKEPWVHWVLAKIPADTTALPEGASCGKAAKSPQGMTDGKGDSGAGYHGPMPPPGKPHRYFFRLYALDATLSLKGAPDKKALLTAMDGHILAIGELMGTYQR